MKTKITCNHGLRSRARFRPLHTIAVTLALAICGAGHAVAAPIIYGSAYTGGNTGAASLYNINPATGAATVIGSIGFNGVGGMDFNPLTGILYAEGRRASDSTPVLLTINPLTGAGLEIGAFGAALPSGSNISDISFRSDGTLFALDGTKNLFTINLTTGAGTLLGNSGNGNSNSGAALEFSASDTLLRVTDTFLYTENQTNGTVTAGPAMNYGGLTNTPRANGMDLDSGTQTMWASVATNFSGAGPYYIGTIDVTTGQYTNIGQTQTGMEAVAVQTVPEPAVNLFLGSGVVWITLLRRNRKA